MAKSKRKRVERISVRLAIPTGSLEITRGSYESHVRQLQGLVCWLFAAKSTGQSCEAFFQEQGTSAAHQQLTLWVS